MKFRIPLEGINKNYAPDKKTEANSMKVTGKFIEIKDPCHKSMTDYPLYDKDDWLRSKIRKDDLLTIELPPVKVEDIKEGDEVWVKIPIKAMDSGKLYVDGEIQYLEEADIIHHISKVEAPNKAVKKIREALNLLFERGFALARTTDKTLSEVGEKENEAVESAERAILDAMKEMVPKEDDRKGVMPYEQGLISGWNNCRRELLARIQAEREQGSEA